MITFHVAWALDLSERLGKDIWIMSSIHVAVPASEPILYIFDQKASNYLKAANHKGNISSFH